MDESNDVTPTDLGNSNSCESLLNLVAVKVTPAEAIALLARGEVEDPLVMVVTEGNDAEIQKLAAEMDASTPIKSLDLSSNRIGWKGADAIAHALGKCTSLIELNMSHNCIGDAGVGALCEILQGAPNLRKLDLTNNSITVVGAARLNAALQQNEASVLHTLSLDDNNIGSDGAIAFSSFIRSHKAIRSLSVRSNHIDMEGLVALVNAAIQNHQCFTLLDISLNSPESTVGLDLDEVSKLKPELVILNDDDGSVHGRDQVHSLYSEESLDEIDDGDADGDGAFNPYGTSRFDAYGREGGAGDGGGLFGGYLSDEDQYDPDFTSANHRSWASLVEVLVEIVGDSRSVDSNELAILPCNEGEDELFETDESKLSKKRLYYRSPSEIAAMFDKVLAILRNNIHPCEVSEDDYDLNANQSETMPPIVSKLAENLIVFKEHLLCAPVMGDGEGTIALRESIINTAGKIMPRCGIIRIKIVEVIARLVQLRFHTVDTSIATLGLVRISLQLFFSYVWNNMLHTSVESLIYSILSSPSLDLKLEVLQESKFIGRLVEATAEHESKIQSTGKGAGYMGHIYRICNRMQDQLQVDSILAGLVTPEWNSFYSTKVSPVNAVYVSEMGGAAPKRQPPVNVDDERAAMWANVSTLLQTLKVYDPNIASLRTGGGGGEDDEGMS